ncbi:hypothetical protein GUJ93_ZPchr0001g30520 [Zizania palustris]|uniref:Uncharacterized protein n=1 Tax=Zizania palustris TaxID=103762 RepID=A0A8J5R710_ZIZPA|nr:hypothetical protein GUJ93_ZPchr0001g30520 [Zizania palustris]
MTLYYFGIFECFSFFSILYPLNFPFYPWKLDRRAKTAAITAPRQPPLAAPRPPTPAAPRPPPSPRQYSRRPLPTASHRRIAAPGQSGGVRLACQALTTQKRFSVALVHSIEIIAST